MLTFISQPNKNADTDMEKYIQQMFKAQNTDKEYLYS